jgi:hypothetical protein
MHAYLKQKRGVLSFSQTSWRRSKALFCMMLVVILLLLSVLPAGAEQTAEYRDEIFSFQYPAAWKQRTAQDGSLILEVPGNPESGVQAFGFASDLLMLTGDRQTDEPIIRQLMDQQPSSSKMRLSSEYDMLDYGTLKGFRVPGTFAGRIAAQHIYLSDGSHLLFFRFVGEDAIKAQEGILTSIMVNKVEKSLAQDGYVPFRRENYALCYPEGYNTLEQSTGIVFMDKTKGNMIMVRARTLDADYTEELAPVLAATYLPKSTKVEPHPKMVEVGPWKAALIVGDTESGPMAFYALGSGRTALVLLFIGQEALTHTETVLHAVTID